RFACVRSWRSLWSASVFQRFLFLWCSTLKKARGQLRDGHKHKRKRRKTPQSKTLRVRSKLAKPLECVCIPALFVSLVFHSEEGQGAVTRRTQTQKKAAEDAAVQNASRAFEAGKAFGVRLYSSAFCFFGVPL